MGTETEMEESSSADNQETPEDIFDGEEYNDEEDFGPTEEELETNDAGIRAVIASIHVEEEDDEVVVYAATMATSNSEKTKNDKKVATNLMKSIKEDYEVWGNGIKLWPVGKTQGHLKANSTKEWVSNSNVRTNRPYNSDKQLVNQQGLPALVKVNSIEAYTCWDPGSEPDAISPDSTQATGIRPKPKGNALKIRLGMKGSGASISYKATPILDFSKTKLMHKLDVVNLDRWDLLLGSPFCNKFGVVLDYKMRTIHFGNTMIKALMEEEEEAAVRKREKRPRPKMVTHWLECGDTKLPKPKEQPRSKEMPQMLNDMEINFTEFDKELEPLHQKWIKRFECIYGPPPQGLPPLRVVNHTIQLINPDTQTSCVGDWK